jgi:hypothetical protein
MQPPVGAVVEPTIELVLEVVMVNEPPPQLEARFDVALQALDDALGLRVGQLAEPPANPELTAEGGERVRRPAGAGVQRPSRLIISSRAARATV